MKNKLQLNYIAQIKSFWLEQLGSLKLYIVQTWNSFRGDWHVLREEPVPAVDLTRTLYQGSIPSFGFYFMVALATAIATFGLLANSAATIIGAMIVAPLMNPIVSLSYAIVVVKQQLLKRSALTLLTGIILTILIAFLATKAIGWRVAGSEILARTKPNLLDLGVAMASGAAAAFAHTRRSLANALAGVAIAVALVPPLSVVGIALAFGRDVSPEIGLDLPEIGSSLPEVGLSLQPSLGTGAFLMFLTNLAGIVFCGGLVFLFQAYSKRKKAVLGLFLSMVMLFLIAWPLGFSLQNLLIRNQVLRSLTALGYQHPKWACCVEVVEVRVRFQDGEPYVYLDVIASEGLIQERQVNEIQDWLSKELEKPVHLEVQVFPLNIYKIKASPD